VEEKIPDLRAGRIGVRVRASLISPGTELGGVGRMRENPDPDRPPRPFGYANAGVVEALGEGVDRFEVGQRVACMGGGYALHADYVCVPQNLSVPIPDGVSFEEASFAHLAATALQAIRRTGPLFGENGVVMGLGLVGNMSAQFARLCGCHVLGVDRIPLRTEIGRRVGIEEVIDGKTQDPVAASEAFSRGYGMDFGIIAFGGDGNEAFEQIYQSLKQTPDGHRMGRIVIVGGAVVSHLFAAGLGNVDVRSAARTGPGYHDDEYEHGRDYPRVFVEWTTRRNLEECLRAIGDGRLKVEPLITHRLALGEIGRAVDLLVEEPGKALGVVLQP